MASLRRTDTDEPLLTVNAFHAAAAKPSTHVPGHECEKMLGAALDDRHMYSIDRAWQTNPISNAWAVGISWRENLQADILMGVR